MLSDLLKQYEYLFTLIKQNDIEYFEDILKKYKDIHKIYDYENNTLLNYACKTNNIKFVKLLLSIDKGIINKCFNNKNNNKCVPLLYACWNGNKELLNLLMSNCKYIKKTVNVKDINDNTPLLYTCFNNDLEMLNLLMSINKHAVRSCVNVKNKYNETPLYFACKHNNTKMVEILIKLNKNVLKECMNIKRFFCIDYVNLSFDTYRYRTPLEYVLRHNNKELIELFKGYENVFNNSVMDIYELLIDNQKQINENMVLLEYESKLLNNLINELVIEHHREDFFKNLLNCNCYNLFNLYMSLIKDFKSKYNTRNPLSYIKFFINNSIEQINLSSTISKIDVCIEKLNIDIKQCNVNISNISSTLENLYRVKESLIKTSNEN